ncbi:MAG TPA: DNA repair protein RecN [Dermatophilaceae bacterium]|nr:DNA repair protein RecN [Dermatophilaceae bacterium]
MLRQIRIRGLGVIQDATLDLAPGLNVLTGETGAGKTMVVSGLGLLLGARADAGLVRDGARAAVVEGVVALPADHPARARAEDAGADVEDELILARSIADGGRSRAHVGGRAAPVGLLGELGQLLVAVHGQADQWRLRRPDQHRDLLDRYAGAPVLQPLHAYQARFDEHTALETELMRLRQLDRDRAREAEVLRAGLEELERVDPRPGEDDQLRLEDARLSHADGLRDAAGQAHALLVGADEQGYDDDGLGGSVTGGIAAARSALAPMAGHDEALLELDRRLAEIGYLAADVAGDLAGYLSGLEVDPARLAAVQQRRAELSRLLRRYGDTIADVLQWGRESASRLDQLEGANDRAAQVRDRLAELAGELTELAGELTAARRHAAARLGAGVTGELARLAMGSAVVDVAVRTRPSTGAEPDDPSKATVGGQDAGWALPGLRRHGADEVEIRLAANPGSQPRSVASAASGGELSRVMLALEVVAGGRDVPTYVFDEVDAGVGGRAALDVGARLAALAATAQVVVVTHLAQVAAYADRHLVVRKSVDGQVTASDVVEVRGAERRREIARMLAGSPESAAAVEHAAELLHRAAKGRAVPATAGPAVMAR